MTPPRSGDHPAPMPRRALLRAGLAAGAAFGLAGCAAASDPGAADPRAAEPGAAGSGPSAGLEPPPNPGAANPGAPDPSAPNPGDSAGPNAGPEAPPGSGPTKPHPGASNGGPAVELVRAHTGRPEVALTFHGAGDRELDRQILEALSKGGAQVTVLAIGTWLAQYPDAARMVVDLGHELGNHTWSHRTMSRLSVAEQRAEIERCRDRLDQLTGTPGAFFRQSAAQHATAEQLKLAGAAGYPRVLSYDLDSLDWTDPGPATVRSQLRKATKGSVVSMHLGHRGTLRAIPDILADLRGRGLRAVTAGQLFA